MEDDVESEGRKGFFVNLENLATGCEEESKESFWVGNQTGIFPES